MFLSILTKLAIRLQALRNILIKCKECLFIENFFQQTISQIPNYEIVFISLTAIRPIAVLIVLSLNKLIFSFCHMQREQLPCGHHSNSSHSCSLGNHFDSNTFICPKEALGAKACLLYGDLSLLLAIATGLPYRQMNYAWNIWTLN